MRIVDSSEAHVPVYFPKKLLNYKWFIFHKVISYYNSARHKYRVEFACLFWFFNVLLMNDRLDLPLNYYIFYDCSSLNFVVSENVFSLAQLIKPTKIRLYIIYNYERSNKVEKYLNLSQYHLKLIKFSKIYKNAAKNVSIYSRIIKSWTYLTINQFRLEKKTTRKSIDILALVVSIIFF